MLASLPMYDLPELRAATDALWQAVARQLGVVLPLTRAADFMAPWRDDQLLFSQTCGYPFTHEFAGRLTYVATPCYDADGCDGPRYRSLIFAREKVPLIALRGAVAAVNTPESMSGMLALRLVFEERVAPLFRERVMTGSHVASLAAVKAGTADVCACDCVTAALLRRHRPEALEGLVEIARSPLVPGLPFVTRAGDPARLRAAVTAALADPDLTSTREALLLQAIADIGAAAYDVIPALEKSLD
ncbi:MAG: PhnD/SsuA/transferrin family substrate-binding protein [Hyphomicrobiales bacterium]